MKLAPERDKLSQNAISRPSKAYIDPNLQIQLPANSDCHLPTLENRTSPIYAHANRPSPPPFYSQLHEEEIKKAMKEAELSYEAWKKMKEKIEKAIAKR